MQIKAIIFDLDGTLVRTTKDYRRETVTRALGRLGVAEFPQEVVDKFWFGPHRNEIITEEFGLRPEDFWPVFRKVDGLEKREKHTEPYPDVSVLEELKHSDIRTGVVTGAPAHIAEMELGLLDHSFDAVVIAQSSNGIRPKPHPHGLEECLEILGIDRKKALFVGNSEEDMVAAQKAGVKDVLIKRKDHNPELALQPSVVIKNLNQLEEIVKKDKGKR